MFGKQRRGQNDGRVVYEVEQINDIVLYLCRIILGAYDIYNVFVDGLSNVTRVCGMSRPVCQ